MRAIEIKVGLKFKFNPTGAIYQVTRISDVSVWFKDLERSPIWREAKTTFLNKFNNEWEVIK